jgi:hypothetical protein
MLKITIKQIEEAIANFLQKLGKHLPEYLTTLAQKALAITEQAEAFLQSGTSLLLVTIDPALEPYREEILAILASLEIAFKAVAGAYQKGVLLTAQAQIMGVADGYRLKANRYYLAAQDSFSSRPEAATVYA